MTTKWVHLILGIVLGICAVAAGVFIGLEKGTWFHLAGLGVSSFLLSLVCMDYMTYNARKRLTEQAKKRKEEIKKLRKDASQNKEEITRLEKELKELENLPLADRIALIFPEPVEVLDRHEIRRALVISLTIVYMLLLFKESPMMEYFIWVYLSVIAFYFGSRVLEKYAEIRKKTEAEE